MIKAIKNFWNSAFPDKATRLSIIQAQETVFPESIPFPLSGSKPLRSMTADEVQKNIDRLDGKIITEEIDGFALKEALKKYPLPDVAPPIYVPPEFVLTPVDKLSEKLTENWAMNNPKLGAEELAELNEKIVEKLQLLASDGTDVLKFTHRFHRNDLDDGALEFVFKLKQIEPDEIALSVVPIRATPSYVVPVHTRNAKAAMDDLVDSIILAIRERNWSTGAKTIKERARGAIVCYASPEAKQADAVNYRFDPDPFDPTQYVRFKPSQKTTDININY